MRARAATPRQPQSRASAAITALCLLAVTACNERGIWPLDSAERCHDGVDNDNNQVKDCADPACSKHPACASEAHTAWPNGCGDGADNDNDGAKDCGDSECAALPACWPALLEAAKAEHREAKLAYERRFKELYDRYVKQVGQAKPAGKRPQRGDGLLDGLRKVLEAATDATQELAGVLAALENVQFGIEWLERIFLQDR